MTKRLDEDEKTNLPFRQDGSNYQTNITIITESGLYNAITGSKKPEAKAFQAPLHTPLPTTSTTFEKDKEYLVQIIHRCWHG